MTNIGNKFAFTLVMTYLPFTNFCLHDRRNT